MGGPFPDLTCHICDFKTRHSEEDMVDHLGRYHNEPTWKCEKCDFISVYGAIMNHHVKFTHTNRTKQRKCPLCPLQTEYQFISSHMFAKHNVKPKIKFFSKKKKKKKKKKS